MARRSVNLAATEWIDEQAILVQELPADLARMALFKVNTGTREQEVVTLKWEYEVKVPELETSVFLIPGERVKNGEERLVVLNRVARSVIESCRGMHPTFVFVRECRRHAPRPITGMNNPAWKSARERAADLWAERFGEPASDGFRRIRVHELKHTFGRRLRAAGVSFEDRRDLLGHKSGRITTHYSKAELTNLIAAAEKVCEASPHKVTTTTWLKRRTVQLEIAK